MPRCFLGRPLTPEPARVSRAGLRPPLSPRARGGVLVNDRATPIFFPGQPCRLRGAGGVRATRGLRVRGRFRGGGAGDNAKHRRGKRVRGVYSLVLVGSPHPVTPPHRALRADLSPQSPGARVAPHRDVVANVHLDAADFWTPDMIPNQAKRSTKFQRFLKFESISCGLVEFVGPSVNDGIAIEEVYGGHDAIPELLFGRDADMAQHGAGQLGEEALDEVEFPQEPCLGGEGELEAAPASCSASQALVSLEI